MCVFSGLCLLVGTQQSESTCAPRRNISRTTLMSLLPLGCTSISRRDEYQRLPFSKRQLQFFLGQSAARPILAIQSKDRFVEIRRQSLRRVDRARRAVRRDRHPRRSIDLQSFLPRDISSSDARSRHFEREPGDCLPTWILGMKQVSWSEFLKINFPFVHRNLVLRELQYVKHV